MSENRKYTAEDIRLYLEGKLSPAEMHAIERASLDDPFLADAIEGMQQYRNNEKFFVGSAQLRESLNERVTKKRRTVLLSVPMLARIAAILIIVLTGVAIIIYTGEKNEAAQVEIAKTEERQLKVLEKRDSEVVPPYKDSVIAVFKMPKSAAPVTNKLEAELLDTLLVSRPQLQRKYSTVSSETTVVDTPESANNANASIAKSLEGRVAGVDAAAKPDQRKESDAAFFDSSSAELNEVVVIAYGLKSKRSKGYDSPLTKNRTERRIEPAGGWLQFENYLDHNKKTNAYDTTLRGIQKLSFIIDSAGRPSLITIIRSLSPAHDQEVIRLLNEGPSWEVKKRNKRKVTLSVIF